MEQFDEREKQKHLDTLKAYIEKNYHRKKEKLEQPEKLTDEYIPEPVNCCREKMAEYKPRMCRPDLEALLEITFSRTLLGLMQEKDLSSPEVYKRGNVEKSLFSKILSDEYYSPSKDTAIQIALGLGLDLKEAKNLIGRAGYRLSRSIRRDVAIEYCFNEGITNVTMVNILLSDMGIAPLGSRERSRKEATG